MKTFLAFALLFSYSAFANGKLKFGTDVIDRYLACGPNPHEIDQSVEVWLGLYPKLSNQLEANFENCGEYQRLMNAHIVKQNRYLELSEYTCAKKSILVKEIKNMIKRNRKHEDEIISGYDYLSRKPFMLVDKIDSCRDLKAFEQKLILEIQEKLDLN